MANESSSGQQADSDCAAQGEEAAAPPGTSGHKSVGICMHQHPPDLEWSKKML